MLELQGPHLPLRPATDTISLKPKPTWGLVALFCAAILNNTNMASGAVSKHSSYSSTAMTFR